MTLTVDLDAPYPRYDIVVTDDLNEPTTAKMDYWFDRSNDGKVLYLGGSHRRMTGQRTRLPKHDAPPEAVIQALEDEGLVVVVEGEDTGSDA